MDGGATSHDGATGPSSHSTSMTLAMLHDVSPLPTFVNCVALAQKPSSLCLVDDLEGCAILNATAGIQKLAFPLWSA